MSVHWRDTMILRRKARKLREKLARSMAKHALEDRAMEAAAARLTDHDAKNEDHKAKTHPALRQLDEQILMAASTVGSRLLSLFQPTPTSVLDSGATSSFQ